MARAYIVLTRNDLDNNMLQVLDLKPNATPSQGSVIYGGSPQGGYQSFYLLDGVNAAVTTAGAGPITIAATTYGLSAYLIDRVESQILEVCQGLAVQPRLESLEEPRRDA